MKTMLISLGFLLLTLEKVVLNPTQKKENFYDVALEKIIRLALSHFEHLNDDSILEMGMNVYGCVTRSKELLCTDDSIEFTQCINSVQTLLDKTLDTKYEEYTKIVLNSIISVESYICNAKIREIIEILLRLNHGNKGTRN